MGETSLALAIMLIASHRAYALDMTIPLEAGFPGNPRVHLSCDNTQTPAFSILMDQRFSYSVIGSNNADFVAHGFAWRQSGGDLEVIGELDTNADLRPFVNYMKASPIPKITLVLASQSLLLDMQMSPDDGRQLAAKFEAECPSR
jgi:hypothetical protein